jgi:hypothetical protein
MVNAPDMSTKAEAEIGVPPNVRPTVSPGGKLDPLTVKGEPCSPELGVRTMAGGGKK